MTKPAAGAARSRLTMLLSVGLVVTFAVAAALAVALLVRPPAPEPSRGAQPTRAAFPVAQPVAFVIGDSQAMGSATINPNSTWVARGVAGLGYLPYVQGAGGTGFVTARPEADLEAFPQAYELWTKPKTPSLIVIEGGGNDITAQDDDITDAAADLIEVARADYPAVPIVVVAPIGDGTGRRAEIADVLEQVAEDEDTLFVDPRNWWSEHDLDAYLVDAKHFGAYGHVAAGAYFTAALREAGVPVAGADHH
ncbi:SGNH/GDSL hydrolase family protein [Microbacterium sp. NPDC058062]|uniref:SGNH/GDSL hydrolase family protein n=1 Tax=Microbacterium sp. NPDC058062 TaxID=3346320 RepID=UPI0036D88A97